MISGLGRAIFQATPAPASSAIVRLSSGDEQRHDARWEKSHTRYIRVPL